MNVAVINLKDIGKYTVKIIIVCCIIFICMKVISNSSQSLKRIDLSNVNNKLFTICLNLSISELVTEKDNNNREIKLTKILSMETPILKPIQTSTYNYQVPDEIEEKQIIEATEKNTTIEQIQIPKVANTEIVTERNINSRVTDSYGTTKIDNQSNYTITEEMLIPDVEIQNKKNILIYHTHTCESYTPCETYNYTMTGNYRTTDDNYNVIRVGTELTTYLTQKDFNVVHDGTYHDYPSYSGSYTRSLETAKKLLEEKEAGIVLDIHRDALGNGDTYGPTVMVNGQRVAQLMFVIGTDGGGLEHPNWVQNLKIAVKIQEKANEMYPGLFRPMIIRNSRYNQHVSPGASIIEVGATANTLGECLLSMQCLANVLEEV